LRLDLFDAKERKAIAKVREDHFHSATRRDCHAILEPGTVLNCNKINKADTVDRYRSHLTKSPGVSFAN